jgi:hypothetical protein
MSFFGTAFIAAAGHCGRGSSEPNRGQSSGSIAAARGSEGRSGTIARRTRMDPSVGGPPEMLCSCLGSGKGRA